MIRAISKKVMRAIWMAWESAFGVMARWSSLYTTQYGICKVMVKKHRGASVICGDGTVIERGDWVAELHLDNAEILRHLQASGSDRAALRIARSLRSDLEEICFALDDKSELKHVKALVGVTLLHRGITHGLGFEQHRISSKLFEWTTTRYLRLLLAVLHPEGNERIGKKKEHLVPIMLIHTRASLKERFIPSPKQVTIA
jgi:hypothetical protein